MYSQWVSGAQAHVHSELGARGRCTCFAAECTECMHVASANVQPVAAWVRLHYICAGHAQRPCCVELGLVGAVWGANLGGDLRAAGLQLGQSAMACMI